MNAEWFEDYKQEFMTAIINLDMQKVSQITAIVEQAFKEDKQIFIAGNGGSAANSSHFAVDLGKGSSDVLEKFIERSGSVTNHKGKKRFRVISLNDNIPWMMAIANDYDYSDIFLRQLENYADEGDVFIGVSVSGKSPNVVKAMQWAKQNGLKTVALTNALGGDMGMIADKTIKVQSTHYGRVEDTQMMILHCICYFIMENYDFERAPRYENVKSLKKEESDK